MTESGDGAGDATDRPDELGEQVGSLGEEAAKLLGALSGWARDQDTPDDASAAPGAGADDGLGSVAARVADAARAVVGDLTHDLDAHLATGSAECTYCPICRAVHLVRATSPEVRAHLTTAATSLLQAAAGLLAALPAGEAQPEGGRSRGEPPGADRPGRAR